MKQYGEMGFGTNYTMKIAHFQYLPFFNFEMTIMSMGEQRGWFNSDKFADLMVVLMCPSGWDEEEIW